MLRWSEASLRLTLADAAIAQEARQTGADVGGASNVAAASAIRSVAVVASSLTVIDRPALRWEGERKHTHTPSHTLI